MRFFEFSDARLFSWKQVLPNRNYNNVTITMLEGDDGSLGDLMNKAGANIGSASSYFSDEVHSLVQWPTK
jgi:hypothetical protein